VRASNHYDSYGERQREWYACTDAEPENEGSSANKDCYERQIIRGTIR
jgi:hypothetical protein